MDHSSSAAAIYMIWERRLKERIYQLSVPEKASEVVPQKSTLLMLAWLTSPDTRFGPDPLAGRDEMLLDTLRYSVKELQDRFGADMDEWQLGDKKLHHAWTRHPLSEAVQAALRERLDAGPVPRPGNGTTVNMTTDNDNQSSGGTFRIIADTADWDRSLGSNFPGQSGDPKDEHYQDLVEPWSRGQYFPLYYSRSKVESAARSRILLEP